MIKKPIGAEMVSLGCKEYPTPYVEVISSGKNDEKFFRLCQGQSIVILSEETLVAILRWSNEDDLVEKIKKAELRTPCAKDTNLFSRLENRSNKDDAMKEKLICQCRWIDEMGNPTPDKNEAIAFAECFDPRSFGCRGSGKPFPICASHAVRRGQHWVLLPLPGVAEEEQHQFVKNDTAFRNYCLDGQPTKIVIEAINKAYPKDADSILRRMMYHATSNFWSFDHNGMFMGVERDGYIHT